MSELTEGDQTDNIRAATRIVYENALRRIKERVFGHEHLVQRLAMAATMIRCYQQVDDETLHRVMNETHKIKERQS